MNLKPEQITENPQWKLLLELPFGKIADFVLDRLKKRHYIILIFWTLCFATALSAVVMRSNLNDYYTRKDFLFHSIAGLLILPLLSIVVHELLHLAAFRASGAGKVSIGMDLKQFTFYATSHNFVIGTRAFIFVALFPFAVISVFTIAGIILLPGIIKWSLSLFLFSHTTMCAGDFAMITLFTGARGKEIVTWDDTKLKVAFFYYKEEKESL